MSNSRSNSKFSRSSGATSPSEMITPSISSRNKVRCARGINPGSTASGDGGISSYTLPWSRSESSRSSRRISPATKARSAVRTSRSAHANEHTNFINRIREALSNSFNTRTPCVKPRFRRSTMRRTSRRSHYATNARLLSSLVTGQVRDRRVTGTGPIRPGQRRKGISPLL